MGPAQQPEWGPGHWPEEWPVTGAEWEAFLAPLAQWPAFEEVPEASREGYWEGIALLRERAAAQRAEAERRQSGAAPWDWRAIEGRLAPLEKHRPRIECADRFVSSLAEEALAALVEGNTPPVLFRRDGSLVCLGVRDDGAPVIRELGLSDLRGRLEFLAYWVRTGGKGQVSPCPVPPEVVNALWARAPWEYFPVLEGVVAAPVYAKDGTLYGTPGYLPGVRLYYHEPSPPELPGGSPGGEAMLNARELLLEELLGDFPFADEASRANALALLLTPFVRGLCEGPSPLFFIDKPTPGTGASLLAEVLIAVFDPAQAVPTPAVQDSEEWRKSITALLLDGGSHVFLDNVNHRLNSPELAAAVTAGVWKARRLSTSETVTVPCKQVWVVTGNNLSASDELISRACWIRLDARAERPEARSGFRHANLVRWVQRERRRLIHACLTLVNCWLAEGAPRRGIAWRTFTPWTEVLGGILAVAAVPGFLENREALREKADTETLSMQQFVQSWQESCGGMATGVAQLFGIAEGLDLVSERLGDGNELSRKTRLGRLLRRMEGRVYQGQRIERCGSVAGAVQYRLVETEEG